MKNEQAFKGLKKEQRDKLIGKIAGLPSEANADAYLQGVVDGRELEREKANPFPFPELARPK